MTQAPIVNHVFNDWPISTAKFQRLNLAQDGKLQVAEAKDAGIVSYDAALQTLQTDSPCVEEACFEYTFSQPSQLVGYSKAILYMSCTEGDDMDVFIQLRKVDKNGKVLQHVNIPAADLEKMGSSIDEAANINLIRYLGPTGYLRASHRMLDPDLSTDYHPVHAHRELKKIEAENIVKLEIGIWPTGIAFDTGEKLMLKIAGHPLSLAEFAGLRGKFQGDNSGRHNVHFGGDTQSHVVVPFVHIT